MTSTSWRFAGAALTLTLLLAACRPDPVPGPVAVTPQPEVLTAPEVPVASAETDLDQTSALSQRASLTVQNLLTQSELTPELYEVLGIFGLTGAFGTVPTPAAGNTLSSPLALGRSLLGDSRLRLSGFSLSGFTAQAITVVPNLPLPTGTWEVDPVTSQSKQVSIDPQDGYVLKNATKTLQIKIEWRVGGAPITLLSVPGYDPLTGQPVVQTQELPTDARATISRLSSGTALAGVTFSMTPGACLSQTGPDALKLNLWAGKVSAPELNASLAYAWTEKGVSFDLAASLKGRSKGMDVASSLDLRGSTTNRCDPASFSFTPAKLDASASVNVPGDRLKADLKLRDLSNLVFSAAELKVQNPFARVQGRVRASAEHNDQTFFSAFGPLADGADLDLIPGDGVDVKYVQGGKVVTTNLQAFIGKLSASPVP